MPTQNRGRLGSKTQPEIVLTERPGLGMVSQLVLIAVLLFSETTVGKLAPHAITPEEVRQVSDGDRIVPPQSSPSRPRVRADDPSNTWRAHPDHRS